MTSNKERDDTEGLADLSEYSLAELLTAVDNPVLASSLKRVMAEDDESNGIVAGFQSAI